MATDSTIFKFAANVAGAKVAAFGRVVVSRADGMGIVFTKIELGDQAVLVRWMDDLQAV